MVNFSSHYFRRTRGIRVGKDRGWELFCNMNIERFTGVG